MDIRLQLKAAQQLFFEALRVAWAEKRLWSYSLLSIAFFGILLAVGFLVGHFAGSGPWYVWLAPELQVTPSIAQAAVKVGAYALLAFVNAALIAVIMYQIINRLKRVPFSFLAGFKMDSAVWRRVLGWAFIAALGTALTALPLAGHSLLRIVLWCLGEGALVVGLFVMPALIKDGLTLGHAFVRSAQLVGRFFVLLLWAFVLCLLLVFALCFVIFAIAMIVAKLLGLIFAWSPFVTLIPFALLGGGMLLSAFVYLAVVWSTFILRAYTYATGEALTSF